MNAIFNFEVAIVEMLSGAEMVVRALQDEGVEYIFGYPGGAVLHIYDALFQQDKVNHILVRHEQAATHAADGYARSTGKCGVALCVQEASGGALCAGSTQRTLAGVFAERL